MITLAQVLADADSTLIQMFGIADGFMALALAIWIVHTNNKRSQKFEDTIIELAQERAKTENKLLAEGETTK